MITKRKLLTAIFALIFLVVAYKNVGLKPKVAHAGPCANWAMDKWNSDADDCWWWYANDPELLDCLDQAHNSYQATMEACQFVAGG